MSKGYGGVYEEKESPGVQQNTSSSVKEASPRHQGTTDSEDNATPI